MWALVRTAGEGWLVAAAAFAVLGFGCEGAYRAGRAVRTGLAVRKLRRDMWRTKI